MCIRIYSRISEYAELVHIGIGHGDLNACTYVLASQLTRSTYFVDTILSRVISCGCVPRVCMSEFSEELQLHAVKFSLKLRREA
jgi:hypothetical protein